MARILSTYAHSLPICTASLASVALLASANAILLRLLCDGNDHVYQADTFSADFLRLYAPDADHLRYSIPAEELDERETIEEGPPAEICLEEILRQFGRDRDAALCLCLLNRTAKAAEIILGFLLWVTSDAVERGILYDDTAVHPMRLKLWRNFNICCLAIWQKQKDLTRASMKDRKAWTSGLWGRGLGRRDSLYPGLVSVN